MLNGLFDLARPFLMGLSPEDAHELTLKSLEFGLYPRQFERDAPCLAIDVFGLRYPNPIGIAAGFDKDARVAGAVLRLGCGFAEVGTITPLPQAGNPKPRVFRLIEDRAIINRLGFNNGGHQGALERLKRYRPHGILAINIGANKDSADRSGDYVKGIEVFYPYASTFTVNISSPNTPGLRDLQAPEALNELLGRIMEARQRLVDGGAPVRPVIVKIAPDIAPEDIAPITERCLAHGVDGIAVSNTTLSRPNLTDPQRREQGGLSGRPLFHRSTVMLAKVYQLTRGELPLIGIGGIDSGATALAKIEAGATLIQLYTGLVYEGPGLISRIKTELTAACGRAGVASITELRGTKAAEWAAKPLE
jgi:dihydroorotate dehydrogenase